MTRILVLYYSSYGHTSTMAEAVAEGARGEGAEAVVKRVPETAPDAVVAAAHFQQNEAHPVATVDELADYDGIVVGTPTRYGRMSSQMASFWDQTGGLWMKGALIGKVGASFVSTATQHGGQEMTQFSILTNLLHMGMTIVGLDYGFPGHMSHEEAHGVTPYGASTLAGADGKLTPHANDIDGAKYLGARVARTASKLAG